MQHALQAEELLSYMLGVAKCERALRELNFAWRVIESTAKMLCPAEAKTILPTMQATRDGFNKLEKQLIAHLMQESVTKAAQEIHFKAQVIIDIVVRNGAHTLGLLVGGTARRAGIQRGTDRAGDQPVWRSSCLCLQPDQGRRPRPHDPGD